MFFIFCGVQFIFVSCDKVCSFAVAHCERDSSGTTRRGGACPRPCAKRTKGDGADSPTRAHEVREAARPNFTP
jgi:hypothetical protein